MEENYYNYFQKIKQDKLKTNLLIFPFKVQYNIISDFLFNSNIIKTFFTKEMNNISCETSFQKKEQKNNNKNI